MILLTITNEYLSMKKLSLHIVMLLLFNSALFAQVGINTDGSAPDNSAMLDLKSTTKGALLPRMTTAERIAIASPATGLTVYDLTTQSYWYYNGIAWTNIDIMAGCATAGIAARLCGDLVLNGYSDWYLPSKDELNKLYLNKVAIGGITGNYYWSSSEYDANSAFYQQFTGGYQTYQSKSLGAIGARAIRAF
jgi:hypothetical protein